MGGLTPVNMGVGKPEGETVQSAGLLYGVGLACWLIPLYMIIPEGVGRFSSSSFDGSHPSHTSITPPQYLHFPPDLIWERGIGNVSYTLYSWDMSNRFPLISWARGERMRGGEKQMIPLEFEFLLPEIRRVVRGKLA